MIAVAFVICAGLGALVRALLTNLDAEFDRQMWGTFLVNVGGAFLLGLLRNRSPDVILVLGGASLGALTTFSTFIAQVEHIGSNGKRLRALLYLVGTVSCGIGAAWLGWTLS